MSKLDLTLVPSTFLPEVAKAFADGAGKHGGRCNWRDDDVLCVSDILPGMLRHLVALQNGEFIAPDSGVAHLAHLAARCAILLDAWACGNLDYDVVDLSDTLELED